MGEGGGGWEHGAEYSVACRSGCADEMHGIMCRLLLVKYEAWRTEASSCGISACL